MYRNVATEMSRDRIGQTEKSCSGKIVHSVYKLDSL